MPQPPALKVVAPIPPVLREEILTPAALAFISHLHTRFNPQRLALLAARQKYQQDLQRGASLNFRPETESIRTADWQVVPAPGDLTDRRVEITGPTERKMMVNALNSGAKVFMADLEDATSPSWHNIMEGQLNLKRAVRRQLDFQAENGKVYKLNPCVATLVVRPRGWHLEDAHFLDEAGAQVSASLLDFGLYFFHNAKELLRRGSGPYFYLPKLEHYEEARLWNQVFVCAQEYLGLPTQTIRATVLIETITAAFQMEEILYELRDHIAGLNAGRWDYIFSFIKRFHHEKAFVLPDRSQITMTVPFMRAYCDLLVKSCHKHGAHAMGGMSAFIPNRRLAAVNAAAISAVKADKEREARAGFDGTWVAHPDLVPIAQEAFDSVLGSRPHQKDVLRSEVQVSAGQLLQPTIANAAITEAGLRTNIRVALQYCERWLAGLGAVAIHNLMEDAATAEISRAQLWQWLHHHVRLDDGRACDERLYESLKQEELAALAEQAPPYLQEATGLLDTLVLDKEFKEFLTLPAYKVLTEKTQPC